MNQLSDVPEGNNFVPVWQSTGQDVQALNRNDLSMLRYILRQYCLTLHSEGQNSVAALTDQIQEQAPPLIQNISLSRGRLLRLIIYRPDELRQSGSLKFVGFVSQTQSNVPTEIEQELWRVDAILIEKLRHIPYGITWY